MTIIETDVCERNHRGNPESRAAFDSAKESAVNQRNRIYAFVILRLGAGATCDEIESYLGIPHQSASARVTELLRDGRLIRTTTKRPTRSQCKASVLVAKF